MSSGPNQGKRGSVRQWWWYHSLTAHQHQKGHTVPKQVIMIATSIQVATVYELHCVRAIRYQAKSEQNVRQDLIPRVRHGQAALRKRKARNT